MSTDVEKALYQQILKLNRQLCCLRDSVGGIIGFEAIVDNYSDLPSASLHTGEIYYVINTVDGSIGNIWYSNGVSWVSSLTLFDTRLNTLENNVYKITYYKIVSGASGTITPPTGATFNSNEFGDSGNSILSKINVSNKPTLESPKTSSGTVVTANLNTTTGAWTTSGTYTDTSVALIYSVNIAADDYANLNNFYIINSEQTNLIVNPMTAVGDTIYGSTLGAATKLAGNTTVTQKFLSQTGNGVNSSAPTWQAISTGLTVGSTAITGGTTTRILYDNAGVLGEYTLTGTGTVVAMQTSPTFVTNITTPLIIGGTSTTQTLTFKTTTGVGTTGADMHFLVGNNGGTEAMTILNNGNFGIGTTSPSSKLEVNGEIKIAAGSNLLWGDSKVRIGTPTVSGADGIGIGYAPRATGAQSISIGYNPTASNTASVAIGYNVNASGLNAIAIGYFSMVTTNYGVNIGNVLYGTQNNGNAWFTSKVGIGTIVPVSSLHIGVAPTASPNYGLISLGSGAFDGATAGFFTGAAAGTLIAGNLASGSTSDLMNLQVAGVNKFKVANTGALTITDGALNNSLITLTNSTSGASLNIYAQSNGAQQIRAQEQLVLGGTTVAIQQSGNWLTNTTTIGSSTLFVTPSTNVAGTGQFAPGLKISTTYNQTGTAAGTDLFINRTETAVGSGNQYLIDGQVGGVSKFKVSNAGLLTAASIDVSGLISVSGGGTNSYFNSSTSNAQYNFYGGGNTSLTSGPTSVFDSQRNFVPTSGTATYSGFLFDPTINQTGGANGITRGLYVNPTLTSAADFRGIEIANNSGMGINQTGASATNTFAGATTFTTNITTPLIIGGTTTTSPLTFKTTTGVGTTGADMHFLVGNNGGTEAMTILNSGYVGVNKSIPTVAFDVIATGNDGRIRITNSTSNNQATFVATNNSYTVGSYGVTGSAYPTYGALAASNIFLYGTADMAFMSDGGVIKFAAGGSTETSRMTSTGFGIGGLPVSKLTIPIAPTASSAYGLVSLGSGAFDGATAGFFTGSANGTGLAMNFASGNTADSLNLQIAGVSNTRFLGSASTSKNTAVFNFYDKGLAKNTDGSVMAIHADDSSPYILKVYNDTYSTTLPALAYYADGSGNTNMGTFGGKFYLGAGGDESAGSTVRMVINNSDGNITIGGSTTSISKLAIPVAPTASANYGLVSLGSGAFDGATAGFFTGAAAGTLIAGNLASGSTSNLMNLQVGGVYKFKSLANGDAYVARDFYTGGSVVSATGFFAGVGGNAEGFIHNSAGVVQLYSDDPTNLRLQIGGTTSSFPALKRSTTSLQVRLADDSNYGGFTTGDLTVALAKQLTITEGTSGRAGQTTLVAGTKAITVTGITTSSRAFVTLVAQGGTSTTVYQYQAVCTADTLTISAVSVVGALINTDTSILNYFIIN